LPKDQAADCFYCRSFQRAAES